MVDADVRYVVRARFDRVRLGDASVAGVHFHRAADIRFRSTSVLLTTLLLQRTRARESRTNGTSGRYRSAGHALDVSARARVQLARRSRAGLADEEEKKPKRRVATVVCIVSYL